MLIKNVLKGIKNKPLRIFGIIFLVMFAGILYVSLGYTLVDVEDSLYSYVDEYNQEDFSFEMNTFLSRDEINYLLSIPNRDYDSNIQYIYQLSDEDKETIVNNRILDLENEYEINIEERDFKQISFLSKDLDKNVTIRIFKNNKEINKTYVSKGRLPENDGEIAIGITFAKSNNLQLNDSIDINNKNYKIVGFIYLVDYIYPQLSNESIVFDSSKQVLAVLSDNEFNNFQAPLVTYYSGVFLKGNYTKDDIDELSNFYMRNLIDSKTAMRTGAIYGEVDADKAMINALSGAILFLAVIIIGIVVNKSINNERCQIGVIKALGYSNASILKAYMIYPFIASIVGSILGYIFGYLLAIPIIDLFDLYYQMPLSDIHFSVSIILRAIILPIIALNVFSAIVIYFIVKIKPLDLIKVKNKNKVNFLVKIISKMLKRFSFKVRFKYSVALRGIGKLFITFTGVLIASIYLVFALSGMKSFDTILGKTFGDSDFKYQIIYNQPTQIDKELADDRFMLVPSEIVIDDKPIEINLIGVDSKMNRYNLVGKDNKNLLPKIYNKDNNVVISSMLSMINNINIGDKIDIKIINQNDEAVYHNVEVVGIMENYTNPYIFMQIKTLNSYYNLDESWYNGVWSKTKTTDNVKSLFDKEEMLDSMENLMAMAKTMIYVMIGVSVVLSIIVLILIANFNIEDNFKTISFLKVMGYRDKEVSSMVLNIYLPVVILAYLVSIPLTLMSIRKLMGTISSELNFAIPFNMEFMQILLGIIIISVTYYCSIFISKRKLNKISLQESLKYNE